MLRKLSLSVILLVVFGLVVLPALAFAVGQVIIGPYEGDNGLAGYITVIYQALGEGSAVAVIMVCTPLVVVLMWWALLWLMRRNTVADSASD